MVIEKTTQFPMTIYNNNKTSSTMVKTQEQYQAIYALAERTVDNKKDYEQCFRL